MYTFKQFLNKMDEDVAGGVAPTNNVGGGKVAGLGVGPDGEPGRPGRLMRRKKFAGMDVFSVNSDVYHKSKWGKKKSDRYSKYVGDDETGKEIRNYGTHWKTKKNPIVLQDEKTGFMQYLKRGKNG